MMKRTSKAEVMASGRVSETDLADGLGQLRCRSRAVVGFTRGGARIVVQLDTAGRTCFLVDGYEPNGSDLSLEVAS